MSSDAPQPVKTHEVLSPSIAQFVREIVSEAMAVVMPTCSTSKTILTLQETATELTISYSQLRQLIAEGELPQPVKIGSQRRYTREQLDSIRHTLMVKAGFVSY